MTPQKLVILQYGLIIYIHVYNGIKSIGISMYYDYVPFDEQRLTGEVWAGRWELGRTSWDTGRGWIQMHKEPAVAGAVGQ